MLLLLLLMLLLCYSWLEKQEELNSRIRKVKKLYITQNNIKERTRREHKKRVFIFSIVYNI